MELRREYLKRFFGYDSFREGQEEVIDALLSGRDVVAVMPTGAGKSICYQIPSFLMSGITVVISPLISLMQDQVKALNDAGIHAAYINSSLTDRQIEKALRLASQGEYKLLYAAPERLESESFLRFAHCTDISLIAVDEAHCISQWGQDFRPSYLKIIDFVESLPKRPVIGAFTATATEEVRMDIECVLKMSDPAVFITGFDRENLYFDVKADVNKNEYVRKFVREHAGESGIIYCATRKNVDTVYNMLLKDGAAAARYHAGMGSAERICSQNEFIYDEKPVMVATNAFGMGIDKSNVRYVLHYNMPQSMENYYQEAGRAGRDGAPAACILLFSVQDVIINRFLLDKKEFDGVPEEDIDTIQKRDRKRLRIMEDYCRTTECLRNYILRYFGENTKKPCGNCGSCCREYTLRDMTDEAKNVINCVYELRGRYGVSVVIDTLRGASRGRLIEIGADRLKTYGVLKDLSRNQVRKLIDVMVREGYLLQTEGKYSILQLGNYGLLKDPETRVQVREYGTEEENGLIWTESTLSGSKGRMQEDGNKIRKLPGGNPELTGSGWELFGELRALRMKYAREAGMPPYVIFSDKTLIEMCAKLPRDKEEMLLITGVGIRKYEKYGEGFLEKIASFFSKHPDELTCYEIETSAEPDQEVKQRKRKKSSLKAPFCLKDGDQEQFICQDLLYVSEICAELNRICTMENVKKATNQQIFDFLVQEGYIVREKLEDGWKAEQTPKGIEAGIVTIEKISQYTGKIYTLLKYPPQIQKRILEHFLQSDVKTGFISGK